MSRVTAELDQAQTEANRARAAEEANELTLVVILARNKELEEARDAAEKRCQEQVERFETDIAEVGMNRLARNPTSLEEKFLDDDGLCALLLGLGAEPYFGRVADDERGR